MEEPLLAGWREVGVPVRETRTHFAESAQGVATDGYRWFVVSNRAVVGLMRKATDPLAVLDRYRNWRRVGVYSLDGRKQGEVAPDAEIWAELVRRNRAATKPGAIHLGAPTWSRDRLLVPTQRPSGIWVLSADLERQQWWPDPAPVWPEQWSWVDLRPHNGLLYSSQHWHPSHLAAFEWESLRRVPSADLNLAATEPGLDRVQGGAFTGTGAVLLSSSNGGGQVFGYRLPDGQSLGVLQLGDYYEMEGLAWRPCEVHGRLADVHILAAQTHYWPFVKWGDSFAVRSYASRMVAADR